MSTVPEKFTGYAAYNEEEGKVLDVKPWNFTPKKWSEDDVTISITHCGVCGSCVHVLTNGWPLPTQYPAICGHEIVGTVVEAGKNTKHKIGDRVGVGAQSNACGTCKACAHDLQQYCVNGMTCLTYQGTWEDGSISQGGYANYIRTKGAFAIPIPTDISSEEAAPLLCAGTTVYTPLRRWNVGPGKKVGVIGIGGLGHLGLMFAKAMGADTYALSSSDKKLQDVVKMGISKENYLDYSSHEVTLKEHVASFDLIICTISGNGMPLESLFLPLVAPTGTFCILGLPEDRLPALYGHAFVFAGISLAGSNIGSPKDIEEMLDFASEKNIRPWVQVRPMADVSQALKDMQAGKSKYRYVMENAQV